MMKKILFILVLLFFLFPSCKKEKDTVQIIFKIISTGKTSLGRNYTYDTSKLKILFSNFKYTTTSGTEILVKDIFLYKANSTTFYYTLPKGNFSTFKFSFGLDSIQNNSIPSHFNANNPLSVEEGLYWNMLKYRFLVFESMIDSSITKDKTPQLPFSMHLGTNILNKIITVPILPLKQDVLTITLDLDKLFILDNEPFRITNFSNHSETNELSKAIQIRDAFTNGIIFSITQ